MNETNQPSVDQRLADLERYVNEAPTAGTPAPAVTFRGVAVHVSLYNYTIPVTLPGVLGVGGGLFVIVLLGVLCAKGFQRRRS